MLWVLPQIAIKGSFFVEKNDCDPIFVGKIPTHSCVGP